MTEEERKKEITFDSDRVGDDSRRIARGCIPAEQKIGSGIDGIPVRKIAILPIADYAELRTKKSKCGDERGG